MFKWVAVAAAIGTATMARAEPTYLDCTLPSGGTALGVVFTLNDADQGAIIAMSTGRTVSRKAIFSPSEVSVPDDYSTWIIDRVSLGLKRIVRVTDVPKTEAGTCKLQPVPPKRAF